MSVTLKPISEQVIVITGASSGIGLATARAAARQGARLVLSSRNDEVLTEVEHEIRRSAVRAHHVTADIGRRNEVERIAQAAVEQFGG